LITNTTEPEEEEVKDEEIESMLGGIDLSNNETVDNLLD